MDTYISCGNWKEIWLSGIIIIPFFNILKFEQVQKANLCSGLLSIQLIELVDFRFKFLRRWRGGQENVKDNFEFFKSQTF